MKLRALEILKAGHKMDVIPLDALDDDAKIVPLGGIGAPVVGVERIKEAGKVYTLSSRLRGISASRQMRSPVRKLAVPIRWNR